MGIVIDDETYQQVVDAFRAHPTKQAAADSLGLPVTTFKSRLGVAAKRGLLGPRQALPGFEISRITSTPSGDYVQQRPERGGQFNLPDGHVVKGVSALLDADGNVSQQWVKTRLEDRAVLEQSIKDAFAGYSAPIELPAPTAATNADLLTIYPIADLHLGLFAWAKESGADYDLHIAADLLKSCMADLVSRSANSDAAVILDVGDYFHADNSQNRTMRSGNALDVDTRYAKVVRVGVELAVHCIDLALQKHAKVVYRKLPGNHDDETSLMLAVALSAWFRNNPRVEIDTDPSRFFMHRHGACMVAATHGDMLKMDGMAAYMAANWPKEWGETLYRYAYTGHIHNEKVRTSPGVRVESFNTIAAKDAWSAGMGFSSPRNMVAITLDALRGETSRLTVSVPR